MPHLLELSDRLWTGKDSIRDPAHHPFATLNQIDEIAPGIALHKNFSNVAAVTSARGLVLLDTGAFVPTAQERSYQAVRSYTQQPLYLAVYSHGHADHAYGLPPFLREAERCGHPRPTIVGHHHVRRRMERYILTAGFNAHINGVQFGRPTAWPTDPLFPTVEYDRHLSIIAGDQQLEIYHARGETDDHSWTYLPDSGVLHTGDFFIWAAPNAGNPQKVQRYAADWVQALRQMAAVEAEFLLPGHGLPIAGRDRIRQALLETAEYLESLWRQTVDGMNEGATLDDLLNTVTPPAHLADRPFLQPIYDEPEFIVRNIFRCYGGWFSGTPSELKPAPLSQLGREIVDLAGGLEPLLERIEQCLENGDPRLACHLVDWAAAAEPESDEVHRLRATVYRAREAVETSTMSRGVFGAAARDSESRLPGELRCSKGD